MTLIARKAGMSIVWDQTGHDSYIDSSTREAGAAAEIVAARKTAKYSKLASQYTSYPTALETLGPLNEDARHYGRPM